MREKKNSDENLLPEEVRKAAEIIRDFCREQTDDLACRSCPFHDCCGGEPYTLGEGVKNMEFLRFIFSSFWVWLGADTAERSNYSFIRFRSSGFRRVLRRRNQ